MNGFSPPLWPPVEGSRAPRGGAPPRGPPDLARLSLTARLCRTSRRSIRNVSGIQVTTRLLSLLDPARLRATGTTTRPGQHGYGRDSLFAQLGHSAHEQSNPVNPFAGGRGCETTECTGRAFRQFTPIRSEASCTPRLALQIVRLREFSAQPRSP